MKTRAPFPAGWKLTLLAVLLAMAMSAGVSQADKGADWGTIELTNVGEEPGASGQATLTNVKQTGWIAFPSPGSPYTVYWISYSGDLSVTCGNLQPGATYATTAGTFRASRRTGTGTVKGKVSFGYLLAGGNEFPTVPVTVDRLDPDGSSVTVLEGTLGYF